MCDKPLFVQLVFNMQEINVNISAIRSYLLGKTLLDFRDLRKINDRAFVKQNSNVVKNVFINLKKETTYFRKYIQAALVIRGVLFQENPANLKSNFNLKTGVMFLSLLNL